MINDLPQINSIVHMQFSCKMNRCILEKRTILDDTCAYSIVEGVNTGPQAQKAATAPPAPRQPPLKSTFNKKTWIQARG